MRTRTTAPVIALCALTLLTACGGSKFEEWAHAATSQKVDANNLTDNIDNGNAILALSCVTWAKASSEQRTKTPASLADYATKAGYPSTADDALAWLDANCKK